MKLLLASTVAASLAVSSQAFAQRPDPEPATPLQPASGSGPTAVVHIDADARVVLQERNAGASEWFLVCASPCDATLPLSASYRIIGTNVRSSASFDLNAAPGERVALNVDTTSTGAFAAGMSVTIAGGGGILLGGAVLTVNWIHGAFPCGSSQDSSSTTACGTNSTANAVGYVLIGAGAVTAVVGAIVFVTHWHSHVAQTTDPPRPPSDAWLRLPQWREDKTEAALPKALGMPLFETAF